MTMYGLIWANVLWNALFVLMALSEMFGFSSVHGALPWWFKWWWLLALAGGNLVIHMLMFYRYASN